MKSQISILSLVLFIFISVSTPHAHAITCAEKYLVSSKKSKIHAIASSPLFLLLLTSGIPASKIYKTVEKKKIATILESASIIQTAGGDPYFYDNLDENFRLVSTLGDAQSNIDLFCKEVDDVNKKSGYPTLECNQITQDLHDLNQTGMETGLCSSSRISFTLNLIQAYFNNPAYYYPVQKDKIIQTRLGLEKQQAHAEELRKQYTTEDNN